MSRETKFCTSHGDKETEDKETEEQKGHWQEMIELGSLREFLDKQSKDFLAVQDSSIGDLVTD